MGNSFRELQGISKIRMPTAASKHSVFWNAPMTNNKKKRKIHSIMCFNLHTHIEIFVSIHIQCRSWVLEAMNKGKGFCVWELNLLTNLGCSQPQNCFKWSFCFPYKLGDIIKELTHWNFRSCDNLVDQRKCVFDWFSRSLQTCFHQIRVSTKTEFWRRLRVVETNPQDPFALFFSPCHFLYP